MRLAPSRLYDPGGPWAGAPHAFVSLVAGMRTLIRHGVWGVAVGVVALSVACGGDGGGDKSRTPTPPAGAIAETNATLPGFTIDGSNLAIRAGRHYNGQLHIALTSVSESAQIKDQVCGQGTYNAGGRFVAVTYAVKNDLDLDLDPATYFNADATLQDNAGRTWKAIDATAGSTCTPSANVALAAGLTRPDIAVPAGAIGDSAIVFDAPSDASGLTLVWRGASVPLPPAGPAPTPVPVPTEVPTPTGG